MKKKEAMTRLLDNYIDDSDAAADTGHNNIKRIRRDSYNEVNNDEMSMLNDDNLVKKDVEVQGQAATACNVWKDDPFKKILNLKEGNYLTFC